MTPEHFKHAQQLLRDPDGEDCERFASRYGGELLAIAESHADLLAAAQALGALPDGFCFCFCSSDRVGDDRKVHQPECAELRAAIAKAEEAKR